MTSMNSIANATGGIDLETAPKIASNVSSPSGRSEANWASALTSLCLINWIM